MTRPPLDLTTIRAVAFDGYGTLFHFHTAEFRTAISELLAMQRLEVDHEEFYRSWWAAYAPADVWGHLRPEGWRRPRTAEAGADGEQPTGLEQERDREVREQMLNGPLPDWHSLWEIWRRQWDIACKEHDLPGDGEGAADHFRHLLSHAPPYEDAHDAIERLDALGLRLGLLSNADEDFLQSALSHARLRFSVIQSSESLRAYKPNRAVYLGLAARLHCDPGEVLYVGDSPIADVMGGVNAGVRVAWVRRSETDTVPERLPQPDMTIHSLAELAERMEGAA